MFSIYLSFYLSIRLNEICSVCTYFEGLLNSLIDCICWTEYRKGGGVWDRERETGGGGEIHKDPSRTKSRNPIDSCSCKIYF